MFNTEVTIALIIVEVLLIAGFLGVIIVVSRFSTQIKNDLDISFEILTDEVKKLREELRSYKGELDAFHLAQKENSKDLNKI